METHRVKARNDAEHSENKIHDDAVAQQFGFRGGLVPGVTVYGYLTWLPVTAWGREWLERGTLDVKLVKPVYDGDEVEVTGSWNDGGRLALQAVNQDGVVCATGSAWMPDGPPAPAAFDWTSVPGPQSARSSDARPAADARPPADERPVADARPPADEHSLAPGTTLRTVERIFDAADRARFADLLGDDLTIYDDLAIAHPGALIRAANEVLSRSVRLGPWMHVSSTATHHSLVADGMPVTTYGRVAERYERKGHRFVELDVVSVAAGAPVLSVRHTAIYEPRRA